MKLYVCYGTWLKPAIPGRPEGHVCGLAHSALVKAGYQPEVVKCYGLGPLPDWLNRSQGRREVRKLTGNNWVPLLVTDSGETVQGSKQIVEWAKANSKTAA